MNRLGKDLELVPLSARFLEEVRGSGLSGEEQDFASRHFGPGDDCRFDTCHSGHDDVTDQHIRLELFECLDCSFSTENCTCFEARLIKNDSERICDHLLVVRNEHPRL